MVIAERVILLYAASGAGKTSLLNAGLLPRLEQREEFEILPPARVRMSADEPPPRAKNAFVASVLANWATEARRILPKLAPDTPSKRKRVAPPTAGGDRASQSPALGRPESMSLTSFLQEREHPKGGDGYPVPRVIVFDQLEELFTSYLEHWSHRQGFFEDVAAAAATDPLLHVIFALREDYLAELDPYVDIIPGGLRTRFRLERLGREPALSAITRPIASTDRHFAEGVAERLVDDLLTFRVDTGEGASRPVLGEFVEPVQLQVVGQDLWSSLHANVQEITHAHLDHYGAVDTALSRFYDTAIAAAAERAQMDELELRLQFEEVFITSAGTRSTVYRAAASAGGIPNEAIHELEHRHLIRAEWSRGARWYELTHDRMIEPIRESNQGSAYRPATGDAADYDRVRRASSALARAEEFRADGDFEEALRLAEKAFTLYSELEEGSPGVADALLKRSEILYALEDYDGALKFAADARALYEKLEDNVALARAWTGVGMTERARGNTVDAVGAFTHALDLYRESGEAGGEMRTLHELALVESDRSNWDASADLAMRSLELAQSTGDVRQEANALTTLGYVAYQRNQFDIATANTREAARKYYAVGDRFGLATVMSNLAYLLFIQGAVDDAVSQSVSAADLYRELGNHYGAMNLLVMAADAEHERENYTNATDLLNAALNLMPDDTALLYRRGVALWHNGDLEDALPDLDRVVAQQPDWGAALSARGQVLARIGRHRDALADLDRALELAGDDSELRAYATSGRGVALAGLGNIEEALAAFDESLRLAPRNAWAHYARAAALEKVGRSIEAHADWRQALELNDPPLPGPMRREVEEHLREAELPHKGRRHLVGLGKRRS